MARSSGHARVPWAKKGAKSENFWLQTFCPKVTALSLLDLKYNIDDCSGPCVRCLACSLHVACGEASRSQAEIYMCKQVPGDLDDQSG